MTVHAFVDETKARGYLVAAAMLPCGELVPARKALTRLVLPGQRRLHFTKEADSRRRQILAVIAGLPVEVVIFDGSVHRTAREQRAACLAGLVCELAERGTRRLVLERDDSIVDADRRLLYRRVRTAGCADWLVYDHRRAGEEPLLAIPDAVAWCWAKGGVWRSRVRTLVSAVRCV